VDPIVLVLAIDLSPVLHELLFLFKEELLLASNGQETTMLVVSSELLGLLKLNLTPTLLLMHMCNKSTATKSVDAFLTLLPTPTEEIPDLLTVALELALSPLLFLLT